MQHDDLLLLPRERGVQQLARKHLGRARQHEENDLELAALRLVHGERVGQFEAGLAIFVEVGTPELEDVADLGGELDLQVVREPVAFLRAPVADDDADLAVGKVAVARGLRVDALLPDRPVAVVDDLVAVDDLIIAHRLGDAAVLAGVARLLDLRPLVAQVDRTVERVHAPGLLSHRAEQLPTLGRSASPRVFVAPLRVEPGRAFVVEVATQAAGEGLPFFPPGFEPKRGGERPGQEVIELVGGVPAQELHGLAAALPVQDLEHLVFARAQHTATEPCRQLQVLAFAGALPARHGELGIAGADARKAGLDVLRLQPRDHIGKGPAGADGGQLARVSHEDEAVHTAQRLQQRRGHFLGEHRALVHDDGAGALLAHLAGEPVAAGRTFVAWRLGARQVLRQRERLQVLDAGAARHVFHAHAGLAGGGKHQDALVLDRRVAAQHREQRCLAGASRADKHAEATRCQLGESGGLFLPGACFLVAFVAFGMQGTKLLVELAPPIGADLVRLAGRALIDGATDQLASLGQTFELVGAGAIGHLDEADLAWELFVFCDRQQVGGDWGVVFILLRCAPAQRCDDGRLWCKGVAAYYDVLEFADRQRPQAARIDRRPHDRLLGQRMMLAHEGGGEHATIDGTDGHWKRRQPSRFIDQIGIAQQVGVVEHDALFGTGLGYGQHLGLPGREVDATQQLQHLAALGLHFLPGLGDGAVEPPSEISRQVLARVSHGCLPYRPRITLLPDFIDQGLCDEVGHRHAGGAQHGAQTRKGAAFLPKAAQLLVDPSFLLGRGDIEELSRSEERRAAGQ